MNQYFNIAMNVIKDSRRILQEKLEEQTTRENAEYILDKIKLDNDIYISLNKEYKKGRSVESFVKDEKMHPLIKDIFNMDLYIHQEKALKSIKNLENTIISTGTGSGKTESFIIPIVDYCIKNSDKKGIKAIIIYPMNALANDQRRRISEILEKTGITFGIFTGETPSRQDTDKKLDENQNKLYKNQIIYREDIIEELPDILITNHVMLDRILTHKENIKIINNSSNTIKFVALDEIHIYRGNKGAHLKFLLDRLRYSINNDLVHIGCSATLSHSDDSNSSIGYIQGNNIDSFISPLFNSNKYNVIEAEYEQLESLPREIENYEEVNLIRNMLYEGSKGIEQIVSILNENGFEYDKYKVYKLLNKNSNILSFRTNLFLMDICGGIKKCIKCGKYHIGTSINCISCAAPLFYISTENPHIMIGSVQGKKISSDIDSLNKNTLYVGIVNSDYKIENDHYSININENFIFDSDNNIEINVDKEGKRKLIYLDKKPEKFNLGRNHGFFDTAKSILRNTNKNNRKILSFIDNRKEVSKSKNLFNDNCIDETFYEIAQFIIGNKDVNIYELHGILKYEIEEYIKENPENIDFIKAFKEFDVWYERLVRYSNTKAKIKTIPYNGLSKKEIDVLEFMINYRVIDSKIINTTTKYINYSLYPLKKILVVSTEENPIEDNKYSKLSLSRRGRNIKKFIEEKYGEGSIEGYDFDLILKSLYRKGYLEEQQINKDVYVYNLKRKSLYIVFKESKYKTIKEIIDNNFYLSATHSSEVEKEEKAIIEAKFQNNELNMMFSTPTLEMGIDIGGLNIVFMKGVPPLPSNFAQRAGRAGRKNDKTALIVTLCSDNSYHDMYYFQNPINMIEGVINPPRFQTDNMNLAKKHINALVYQINGVSDKEKIITQVTNAFNTISKDEIKQYIENLDISQLKKESSKTLYENNKFPDYSFRRDEVKVYDINALEVKKEEKEKYELSSREPEVAYREYIPGITTYMSGEIMKFADLDIGYKNIEDIRVYKEIYAKEDKGYISKDKTEDRYDTYEFISYSENENGIINLDNLNRENLLKISYANNIKLCFINNGFTNRPFLDEKTKKQYKIGQFLERQALLISGEVELLPKERLVSLVALIDNSIKELYGLDESEIKILYDENRNMFALYDSNGNKNIDLNKIYINLNNILDYGYRKVRNCKCDSINGCYVCIKSYNMNKYAALLNKQNAYKMAGYINGKNRLPVKVTIKEDNEGIYDIDIKIRLKNNKVEINYYDKYITEEINGKQQNEVIFNSLIKVLQDINDAEYVRITSNLNFLVSGINGNSDINKSGNIYNLFKFIRLKYENVYAIKG